MTEHFEHACRDLDSRVEEATKRASQAIHVLRRLKGAAKSGDLNSIARLRDAARLAVQALSGDGSARLDTWAFDTNAYLGRAYLEELKEALKAAELPVRESGDSLIVPPVLIRLDAKNQALRIGRRRLGGLRPSAVVAELQRIRKIETNASDFFSKLYKAYRFVCAQRAADDESAVDLETMFSVMTLAPDTEYGREQFAMDLARLHAQPDLRTKDNRRIEFPASTGSKGRRFVVYTDDGTRLDLVAVRFVREA